MKRPLLTRETFLQLKRAETYRRQHSALMTEWQDLCKLLLLPVPTEPLAPVNIQDVKLLAKQAAKSAITSNVTEFFNIGVSKTGVLPLSPLCLKLQVIKSQLTLRLTPSFLIKATKGLRSTEALPLLFQPSQGIRCVVWSNAQKPGHSGKLRIKMYSGTFHLFAHGNPRAPSFPLSFLPPW